MGTQVFALTEHGETAGDIAEQNEENRLLLKILRAAEGTVLILYKTQTL